jgi:hypothetical protein
LYCGPISQHMRGGKEQFKIYCLKGV